MSKLSPFYKNALSRPQSFPKNVNVNTKLPGRSAVGKSASHRCSLLLRIVFNRLVCGRLSVDQTTFAWAIGFHLECQIACSRRLSELRFDPNRPIELEISWHAPIASAPSIGYDWVPAACRRWNEDVFSPFRDSSRFHRQSPDCCAHRTLNVPNSVLDS